MLTVLIILGALMVVYAIVAVTLYIIQPLLLYSPDKTRVTPASIGLNNVDEMEIETPDGEKLVCWHSPADPGYPTILYYHGVSGNLASRRERVHRFTRRGYGVFMASYRSYSGSTGMPSQAWLISDGLFAYDTLRSLGVESQNIVVYGESLGTGVAIPVAGSRDVSALVLEAPYTSIPDVISFRFKQYRMFPFGTFLLDKFESRKIIHKVDVPLLVMHGGKDELIPLELGQEIFDLANEPKEMMVFDTAGHTGLFRVGAFTEIRKFLEKHTPTPRPKVTELRPQNIARQNRV